MLSAALLALSAFAADPWSRPEHLRAVTPPPTLWSDLSAARLPIRLWWDGAGAVEVQALRRGRWRSLSEDALPGWVSRPLPVGTPLRVRREGGRWSAPVTAPAWVSPAELAILASPGGTVLAGDVGQVVSDGHQAIASTLGGGVILAQPGKAGVTSLTRWDGLPDDRVIALDERDGQLLVGTAQGAALFQDEVVVEVWDDVLPDPYVQAVLIDDDAGLWVGTYQGLALHRTGQLDTVLAPWSVFSLSADNDGGVWVGYEGLRRLDSSGSPVQPELPAIKVFGSVVSGEDVWVASEDQGVKLLSDGQLVAVPEYPTSETYSLTLSPYGPWAAAGRQGLAGPNGLRITRLDGLPSSTAWAVASQGTGLWVGTNAGLSWVQLDEDGSAREIRSPRLSRWPADRSASALLLREGGAFVAGDYGVWSIGMPHDDAADLIVAADPPVLSLLAVEDDVWAIGRSAVRLNADGDLHRVGLRKRPDAAAAWAGTVWIGDERGLFRYEAQRDDFVQMAELPDVSVLASDEHALWAVGKGGVVFRVVFGAVRPYAQTQHALALSSDGEQVCVGTLNGLERLQVSDGAVTDLLEGRDEGVAIPAVAHDGRGGCWFAAEDGTVGRIRSDGSIASSQLPDDAWPTAMVIDGADAVWVLTERGSWRVRL
ncbi:MAG: hypothetical protein P8R54_10460 [Myxococcota bacterium]|nr:hypothetical protein [Myxococcota bacterium]